MISRQDLKELYISKGKSASEIGKMLACSERKVNYWIAKFGIPKRSISEAIYLKHNPNGDPFEWKHPTNLYEAELRGLGLGLYWGEGTKRNKTSLRLGNTDPNLIRKFIEFLEIICGVEKRKIRFSLQVFSDTDPEEARAFWCRCLKTSLAQFSEKIIITPSRGAGTYRYKNKHGVLMVYVHNRKLRDIVCGTIENLK